MSMKKNSSTSYSSINRVLLVLVLSVLLVSSEFAAVNGRPLRSMSGNAGIKQSGGDDGVVVSANKSRTSRVSFRGLAVILASGPSGKGRGH
ncbi:hypothetical protein ERO13_A06G022325v2 [Gossypium hirsutum]|uniref:Transmembrane protein n=4 Tax=Gossypium TaxID=3633 RepID=A0ABR0PHU0_GOSAR|nr:hypothetical protein ES319_A06G024700v1 [Gossypium barbadense]KAG4193905.1 hypothetical protein ERO13_A06G022325v2 [Gossypium hirsutum]KAK5823984.1 hypothetical protein PVK06_018747 [Gossypium arboreum]TYH11931.1 hypothetical protein ES288_A06G025500v1 [Gossypium darwinii]